MALEGIFVCDIYGNSMVIKMFNLFHYGLLYSVMWGLYVDHNSSAVGYIYVCVKWGHICLRGMCQ